MKLPPKKGLPLYEQGIKTDDMQKQMPHATTAEGHVCVLQRQALTN